MKTKLTGWKLLETSQNQKKSSASDASGPAVKITMKRRSARQLENQHNERRLGFTDPASRAAVGLNGPTILLVHCPHFQVTLMNTIFFVRSKLHVYKYMKQDIF
jgi:hypothetical protein